MEAEKHIKNGKRLNQALNGTLSEIQHELANVMKKYSIDAMPELALDICQYVIEEMHMEKLNLPMC